jgi:DNA repair protein RadA/Sms
MKFYCSGAKRVPPVCDHQSDERWIGPCPGCGRFYDIDRTPGSSGDEKARTSLASLSVKDPERLATGIPEFDRVLGGGVVKGSPVLLSGDPGNGKTTLLIQVASFIASAKRSVLFTAGEMSREDVGFFAKRTNSMSEYVDVMGNEGDVYKIVAAAEEKKPALLIVDSINTAFMDTIDADVNTPRQIAAAGNYLTSFAKQAKIAMFIVCQMTKDGDLAGPKNLEHLVDAIVYFDNLPAGDDEDEDDEELAAMRVLSIGKNRFGPPGIKALLEMTEQGLKTPSKRKSKLLTLV